MHRRIEIDWALSSMTPKAVPAAPLGLLATSQRKIGLSALWSTVLGDAKPAGDDRRGLPSVAMLE
jgi:hypothetical protein